MSTKTHRPVAMNTPKPPKTPSGRRNGAASKQAAADNKAAARKKAILEGFDLEVTSRVKARRDDLDLMLKTFLDNVTAEVFKIPRDMRTMTLAELETCWAGSFADTARALAEQRFARYAPETDTEKVLAAAKRKRDVQSPLERGTPRGAKNPRTKPLPALPGKRRVKPGKRTKPVLPPSTGTSTLPQHHEFDPRLPKTPKARAPRRNESFFSSNGSPVDLGLESEADNVEEEADDDLPDPEAMEAAAEREAISQSTSRSVSRSTTASRGTLNGHDDDHGDDGGDAAANVDIPLSDGRMLSFNPLALSPGRIDDELASGGLAEKEKNAVKKRVQDEVFRSLTERMERWKAM